MQLVKLRTSFFILSFSLQISLFGQWAQTNGPLGGNVFSLAEQNGIIWAGTYGGLYRSTNNALSWEPVAPFFANHIVTDIQIIDDEIWVAAKESGKFVFYRSADGGATWTATNLNNPVSADVVTQLWKVQNSLILRNDFAFEISHDNGATWSDFELPAFSHAFTADGERMLASNYFEEIYLSNDAGTTWQLLATPANCCFIQEQEIYIEDSLIIAVAYDIDNTILRSWDLGQTWEHLPVPTNGINLYGTFSRGSDGFLYCSGNELAYSSDNGATWDYSWWDEVNDFLPLDTGWLVALGRGAYFRPKSSNSGYWLNNGLVASTASDLQTTANGMLFALVAGEILRSTDEGNSWAKVALPPCSGICQFDFQCHEDTVFLLQYRNLYLTIDYGETWQLVSDSLNYYGPEIELTYHQGKFFIYTSISGVHYSDDWGNSWKPLPMPIPDEYWQSFFIQNDTIIISETFGVVSAYRSSDMGQNWKKITGPPLTGGPQGRPKQIFYHNGYIFFNAGNGLFRSPDFGDVWTKLPPNGLPVQSPLINIADIVKIGAMADTIYASISGHGVYRSLDEGENWTGYNDGLLTTKTGHFATDDSLLYVSTGGTGVWKRNVNIASDDTPVKELPASLALSVYPNPASNHLTLTIPNVENLNGRLLLTDIWGRQLMNEKIHANPIALSPSLPDGVYQMQLISSQAIYTGKMLILKN